MMPLNQLILCTLFFLSSIFPSISIFSSELALRIRWPKHWNFNFSNRPSNIESSLIPLIYWESCFNSNNNILNMDVVLEKTLESPLDSKEIKPVNPKGNQPWLFIGRTDAETPILWPRDVKNWLIEKDPDAGKDWRQDEKGTTEDEMVGWHHQLNGHEFEQAPGVGDGQGSLACCSPWGCKESDITERLNWTWRLIFWLLFLH